MSCKVTDELTAYVDGTLEPAARARVEAHLPTCAECQETHALLARTVVALSALPPVELSPEVRRRTLRAVSEARPGWRQWRWPALALGVATASMALVLIGRPPADEALFGGPAGLELAANFEVVRDLDVVGVERLDDWDVVEHLDELEASP